MSGTSSSGNGSRRNFLKVGAGVVGGVVVGAVGVAAYESSVIGSNNSSSSSTVASLQNQLTATQSQLNQTVGSLNNANSTISNLNAQLSTTQGALSSAQGALTNAQGSWSAANAQNSTLNAQNSSLNSQLTATQGSLSSANAQVSTLQSQVTAANSQVSSLQASTANLMSVADALTTLGSQEAAAIEAAIETIIPTDSNGPGGKEAGVLYFIDKQLAGEYGKAGNMYMDGPYVQPNIKTSITVDGITYSGGTPPANLGTGYGYQYAMNFRNFWRYAILALESYSTSAYGGAFETLSPSVRVQVLTDLAGNKPGAAAFGEINPADFFWELFFMTWAGFLMDPMHGGNRGMVGWELVGFNGLNNGNFYGEGMTTTQLMTASTPTKLRPASLAQFQAAAGYNAGAGGD